MLHPCFRQPAISIYFYCSDLSIDGLKGILPHCRFLSMLRVHDASWDVVIHPYVAKLQKSWWRIPKNSWEAALALRHTVHQPEVRQLRIKKAKGRNQKVAYLNYPDFYRIFVAFVGRNYLNQLKGVAFPWYNLSFFRRKKSDPSPKVIAEHPRPVRPFPAMRCRRTTVGPGCCLQWCRFGNTQIAEQKESNTRTLLRFRFGDLATI